MNNLKLHASKAHIWAIPGGCPGSVAMSAAVPHRETPETFEGKQAHKIAALMIDKYIHGLTPFRDDPAFVAVTDEMFEAADVYARNVRDVSRNTRIAGGEYFGIEKALPCPDINAGMTCITDAFIFNRAAGHLWIWEFKFGHTPVEVFENPQLICNLSAVSSYFKIDGHEDQKITVHAVIVQPRGFHHDGIIREWEFKLCDIRALVNIFKSNGETALNCTNNKICNTGSYCKDCSAHYTCHAALYCGVSLFETLDVPIAETMSNESLGLFYELILRAKQQITCLESGISAEVKERLKSGANVPGFSLEQSYGHLSWSRPAEDIARLIDYFKINIRKELEILTPTQAKQKGVDENFINRFSKRESIGFKLVPINTKKARSIFQ
ncbi:MAG: DUF2800 domain-containing protein [Ignavibacteria bacterium]|nr:DUF2800 domain-containing protein [Ignavibacteria bacterium]